MRQKLHVYNFLHVLSFSVGYIFSASHQIPPSTELPNYDKVRLHWKKQVLISIKIIEHPCLRLNSLSVAWSHFA